MTTAYDQLDPDVLTQSEFDALLDYSYSIPSGTTIGKKWKRRWPYRDDEGPPFFWYTGEYIRDPEPGMIGIKWRRVVIVNSKPIESRTK
jgi:hypothetical protein